MESLWLEAAKRRRGGRPPRLREGTAQRNGRRTFHGSTVRRKVRELRRIIPGGTELHGEQLFLRTGDYIYQLRWRVHVLKALLKLYMP